MNDTDPIDLEKYAKEGKKPPKAKRYRIRIDKEHYLVDVPSMTGRELLELAGKTPVDRYSISEKIHGGAPVKIGLDDVADFTKPGVERFRTLPLDQTEGETDQEPIDLEKCAKAGKKPPKAERYRIRIDKVHYVVEVPSMTGRELLELAEKTPVDRYSISEKVHGGAPVKIGLDDVADFTKPGVERFRTLPLDQTEGEAALRREFILPPEDVATLERLGYPWETILVGKAQWLLIHDYPIPAGYKPRVASLAFNLPTLYPDAQIDMVNFNPPLAPTGKQTIRKLTNRELDGKTWQQWSRHRTGENPWRPGIDDLEAHLELVDYWLRRELPDVGEQAA